MRFMRAYSAVFSITLLLTSLPTGVQGLVHATTLADARYSNRIAIDDHLWLMVVGFAVGTALAQSRYTRCRQGRLRAYQFTVALFLGLWITTGVSFALATAEWGGLSLALVSAAVAPLIPWTESGTSLWHRLGLSLAALGAAALLAFSSAQFLDAGFLFALYTLPIAALGGTIGILGAERIVEHERSRRVPDPAREDALNQLRSMDSGLA